MQNGEREVSSENNVKSKQHDDYHEELIKITWRNFKVSRDFAWVYGGIRHFLQEQRLGKWSKSV